MVADQVEQVAILAHGDALCTSIVVFGDCSPGNFIVVANERRCHTADVGFHPFSIAVVQEGRAGKGWRGR